MLVSKLLHINEAILLKDLILFELCYDFLDGLLSTSYCECCVYRYFNCKNFELKQKKCFYGFSFTYLV